MIGPKIRAAVEREIADYETSQLAGLVAAGGAFAIKFVQSRWAANYGDSEATQDLGNASSDVGHGDLRYSARVSLVVSAVWSNRTRGTLRSHGVASFRCDKPFRSRGVCGLGASATGVR
jgi:hypothetical protein